MKYSAIEAVVMDMDGVLWRGDEPLPGITEIFEWLNEHQIPYALATNNSSKTQRDYVNKLERMGVAGVPEDRIVTAATATAAYMQTRYRPGTCVHVLGMDGLRIALADAGFDVYCEDEPEVVVAGIDFTLTYESLRQAALYIRAGADFVGTNPDRTFPTPDGLVPGAGSLIAALETATDQQAFIVGKPNRPMFETALRALKTRPEQTLMIGDRLNTDILGAQQVGLKTVLLFTGVTSQADLDHEEIWPDVAYEGLPDVIRAWAGDAWYRERIKAKRA
jgi:4-nitrophenyl phosphatase